MTERKQVPESEILRQQEYMKLVRAMERRPQTYHIVSMGCQMNERDSETIAGMLNEMGMTRQPVREQADLILYNTCCVRENAENKALGNVIWLKELKKDKPDLLICVGGCMTQEKGMAEAMKRNYPFIDLVYGTHNLYRLPEYLHRVLRDRAPVVEVVETDGEIVEGLPEARQSRFSAFVNIMYGCNNFCTYCIVPYVRGRERSREPEAVLEEALRLRDAGRAGDHAAGTERQLLSRRRRGVRQSALSPRPAGDSAHPLHDEPSQGSVRRADRGLRRA